MLGLYKIMAPHSTQSQLISYILSRFRVYQELLLEADLYV